MTDTRNTPHALSPRLRMVFELVPKCGCAADIGTDHGFLLAALLESERCVRGFGGDVNPGPLSAAVRYIAQRGLTDRCTLTLSDGCDSLPAEGIDSFVFAGMGGELIARLVLRCEALRSPDKVLICQPMTRAHLLRALLCRAGFRLEQEAACREDARLYTASVFRWDGVSRQLTPAQSYAGLLPGLRSPDADAVLEKELARLRRIAQSTTDPEVEQEHLTIIRELEAICSRTQGANGTQVANKK